MDVCQSKYNSKLPSSRKYFCESINNLTYTYIEAYIQDLIGAVFTPLGKDPIIHLGGDEVDAGCWNEDKTIVSYMKTNNLTTQTLW